MTPDEFRAMRKSARMTQAEMADRLDVSRKTIVNYENGIHPIPVDVMSRLETVSVVPKPGKAKVLNGAPYYRERPGMPSKYKIWQRRLDHPFWYFHGDCPARKRVEDTMTAQGHGKPAIRLITDRVATLSDLDGYTTPTADQAYAMLVKFGVSPLEAYNHLVFIGYEHDLTVADPDPKRNAHKVENAWRIAHGSTAESMAEFYRLHPHIKPEHAPYEPTAEEKAQSASLCAELDKTFGL